MSVDIHTKSTVGQSENTKRREIVGYHSGVTEDLVFWLVTVFLWANSSRRFDDRSAYIFRVKQHVLGLLDTAYEGTAVIRNVGNCWPNEAVSHAKRPGSSALKYIT